MIRRINARIDLLTQVSHIGDEKTGSTPVLRTMTIFHDGRHIRIPYVSGNALRGLMRRVVMNDFFERIGAQPSTKLYHTFFSGGVLVRGQESDLDIAFKHRVRTHIPPLGLFGAAFSNQMIQGSLVVEHAIPIARETAHFIEHTGSLIEKDIANAKYSIRTFTDIEFFTRRDDVGRGGVVEEEVSHEGEQEDADDTKKKKKDKEVVQMKVEHEVLIAGTALAWGFVLRHASDVEASCLAHAISLFAEWGAIGGKSASGLGRIALKTDIDTTPGQYLQFVSENKEKIARIIMEMEKML